MAISVSATFARWTNLIGKGQTSTSGSFTPANNSLLVLCVNFDNYQGGTPFHTVEGGSLAWTKQVERNIGDSGATDGGCTIWTAPVTTGASMTVSIIRTATGQAEACPYSGKVYVVTGQHTTNPIGANGEGSSTTNNLSPTLFTATGAGRAFYCGTDWAQRGTPTSTDTGDGGDQAGRMSWISCFKAADHAAGAGAITGNMDGGGTSACDWNWCALEILADSSAAATSFHPEVLSRASRSHILMR